jgi:hypothetical protein
MPETKLAQLPAGQLLASQNARQTFFTLSAASAIAVSNPEHALQNGFI